MKYIWIGLCHRHCIENINKSIKRYRDEVEITDEKAQQLLLKFDSCRLNISNFKNKGIENISFDLF